MSTADDAKTRQGPAQPMVLDFDDNRLLGALFGEYDRNLARIEQKLGVSLFSRGNRIAISGSSDSRESERISRRFALPDPSLPRLSTVTRRSVARARATKRADATRDCMRSRLRFEP